MSNNKPLLGVIDVPAIGVTYWAARGLGAWKHLRDSQPERISANQCASPASAVVSRSHLDDRTDDLPLLLSLVDHKEPIRGYTG